MTPVRHFYVDNLLGNLDETVAVAKAGQGDYPEGSVLQLMPNEVMIKQQKGFNPATRDWEFFWIDVDKDGSKIYTRGFAEVRAPIPFIPPEAGLRAAAFADEPKVLVAE